MRYYLQFDYSQSLVFFYVSKQDDFCGVCSKDDVMRCEIAESHYQLVALDAFAKLIAAVNFVKKGYGGVGELYGLIKCS